LGFRKELHMSVEETRRAETLFKKEQQQREAEKAMAEYRAELQATREKTVRLRSRQAEGRSVIGDDAIPVHPTGMHVVCVKVRF
jgi:hypothetical protein